MREQTDICKKFNSEYYGINLSWNVGVALSTLNLQPLNALRTKDENGTSGWYIWGGEYSQREDFFDPLCGDHLKNHCPQILKYLALKPGYRVMIDSNGFEDVWYDSNIIH